MKATALICDASQNFTLEDVVLRDPAPDQIAVRTHTSGVSIGTEFALIRGKLSWGPYPLCTGYMGTGIVETVGADVEGFSAGDEVYFRRNETMELAGGEGVSCVAGTHCSHIVLKPDTSHGAAKMVPGAPMDAAAMFVLPAVGLYGVDMANPRMGQTVAVYGCGCIGLGVVAACVHRGCEVIAIDVSERQLDIARKFGADHVVNGSSEEVRGRVEELSPGGADVVFECTGIPECLDPAMALCRTHGSFVWQGNYGKEPVAMDFLRPHGKKLKMFFPSDDGMQPCRRAVVRNMALGALKWDECITHRINFTEAPAMFERIHRAAEKDIIGVVIDWTAE